MNDQTAGKAGVLLVGHGTRSLQGTDQFLHVCRHFARALSPLPVETAFLELQQPEIGVAVAKLIERGVRRLTVVPLLLFAAGHAKEDIPQAVRAALQAVGPVPDASMEVTQADHFGCHPALVELSRRRFEQAVTGKARIPGDDCCLLLVGRGNRDREAIAEMHEFARLRLASAGGIQSGIQIRVAFLAMAQPLLAAEVEKLAAEGVRRVIVQPHLLFDGELVAAIQQQVMSICSRTGGQEWLVAPALADPPGEIECGTELLTNVMLDRYYQAAIHVVATARDS